MEKESLIITGGGWYQRTTLHLTEVYDLFSRGQSYLPLSKDKLKALWENLDLEKVTREASYLEYVKATTRSGIEIRYYEDGLYVFEISDDRIGGAPERLKDYFEKKYAPAINYIFSLGAATPKILADIKEVHPIAIGVISENPENIDIDQEKYGKVYSKITSGNATVYKTQDYIFVAAPQKHQKSIREIIEMQIFFREFKDQLQKYLNIHRSVWEELDAIGKKDKIKGKDVEGMRAKIESQRRTVDLIRNRINQMEAYVKTRGSLAQKLNIDEHLLDLFRYRFEDLGNTLVYVKEIWAMTTDYIQSTIDILGEVENRAVGTKLDSIQILTGIGVVSVLIGYLESESLPSVSIMGVGYLIILAVITFVLNKVLRKWAGNRKYEIETIDQENKIDD